jgi:protein phosphatase
MTADTSSAKRAVIRLPRNTLVVLVGPAGCGKSTFAATHFNPTEVVSSDECRALISDDPANQRVSSHAFDLMHFIIVKRLLLGRLTVCDATNLERSARSSLLRIARRFDFKTAALVFDIPLDVCARRNSGRRRVVPEEALHNHYSMLQKAIISIHREEFDHVFLLNQRSLSGLVVEISPRARSRPAKRPC